MHVKTNIEHSSVQIIVLAMCPLLFVVSSLNDALLFVCGTLICLAVSQLFLMLFNKYLNNNVKAMLTAIISALIVTASMIFIKEKFNRILSENLYFVVFSTTIISSEFIYFRNKAVAKHYVLNILKIMSIFAVMTAVYACIKEFLAYGSIYGKQLSSFCGVQFCETMIFNLLLLASLCAGFDFVVRNIDRSRETKDMVYQKYVKIIRSEKAFQYDILRREKLLTNEIEINKINKVDAEKLAQKQSENELVKSVSDVVNEENEISEPNTDEDKNDIDNESAEIDNNKSKKKKGGKK